MTIKYKMLELGVNKLQINRCKDRYDIKRVRGYKDKIDCPMVMDIFVYVTVTWWHLNPAITYLMTK